MLMKCEICGKDVFVNRFSAHLREKHEMNYKTYFDAYIEKYFHKCENCDKEAKWNGRTYNRYCSQSCANAVSTRERHKTIKRFNSEKIKKTNLEKYGCGCNLCTEDGIKKKQKTWNEKYGADHPMKNGRCKEKANKTRREKNDGEYFSNETLQRIKETCLSRYGVDNVSKAQIVKDKISEKLINRPFDEKEKTKQKVKETCAKRYGGIGNAVDVLLEKYKKTCIEKYGENYAEKIKEPYVQEHNEEIKLKYEQTNEGVVLNFTKDDFSCKCAKCNSEFVITKNLLCARMNANEAVCIKCNPIYTNTSNAEHKIAAFIKTFYNDEIVLNDRTILDGNELDIFLPKKKIAIEYDGVFWHNELHKPNDYHLSKTELCESKGIQLIHIFEDEWLFKNEIVKSRIRSILGENTRIMARKCVCRTIGYKESELFLNANHIQGNCSSKFHYGLFYDDELVAVMTFGKSRFGNNFELLRFANKLNLNVIGGASKLFKHFLTDHPEIQSIISYADRRWSIGDLYEKLGFEKKSKTPPAYWYVVNAKRHNRMKYQKHKLVAEGFDKNKSEHEIMLERKIFRIYDCGNILYKYNRG